MALYKDYNIGGYIVTLNMDHVDVAIQTDDSVTTIKGDAVNQVKFTNGDVQLRASDRNKDGQKKYTLSLLSDWEETCANQPPKSKSITIDLGGDDAYDDGGFKHLVEQILNGVVRRQTNPPPQD